MSCWPWAFIQHCAVWSAPDAKCRLVEKLFFVHSSSYMFERFWKVAHVEILRIYIQNHIVLYIYILYCKCFPGKSGDDAALELCMFHSLSQHAKSLRWYGISTYLDSSNFKPKRWLFCLALAGRDQLCATKEAAASRAETEQLNVPGLQMAGGILCSNGKLRRSIHLCLIHVPNLDEEGLIAQCHLPRQWLSSSQLTAPTVVPSPAAFRIRTEGTSPRVRWEDDSASRNISRLFVHQKWVVVTKDLRYCFHLNLVPTGLHYALGWWGWSLASPVSSGAKSFSFNWLRI